MKVFVLFHADTVLGVYSTEEKVEEQEVLAESKLGPDALINHAIFEIDQPVRDVPD